MKIDSKIMVLGAGGMVGSAVVRSLENQGYEKIYVHYRDKNFASTDLTNKQAVQNIFAKYKPEYVFICAAVAGGIHANQTRGVEFLSTNLKIQQNCIEAASENKVKRLIFLGSSCIYPKQAPQPLKEEYLLTGPLEETNKPYAIAKIAGIELCRAFNRERGTDFISVMPCNLYGPGDKYDDNGHVIPMLIRKFHDANRSNNPTINIWGDGTPKREFMHSDDLADVLVKLMAYPNKLPDLINIGSGEEVTISRLVEMIAEISNFSGNISPTPNTPNGTMRKILDCSRLQSILPDWKPKVSLMEGLKSVYEEYKSKVK